MAMVSNITYMRLKTSTLAFQVT